MSKNIVICGYHGYDNCGDEAILSVMLQTIREQDADVHVTILSGNPEQSKETYGIHAVYRYDLLNIFKALKKADVFVFGGGALLQDITSSRSLYYYLTILTMARICKVRTMVYANGMGPLLRKGGRKSTARCLNRVQLITVRDQDSAELLREIGVKVPPIMVTVDPVFCFDGDVKIDRGTLLEEAGLKETASYVGIGIRSWMQADPLFVEKIAVVCDAMQEQYGFAPLFLPMQYESDTVISEKIMEAMKTKGHMIRRPLTVEETDCLIGGAGLFIGMRLHSLIFAVKNAVPIFALSYDPKVAGLMKLLEDDNIMDVGQIDEGKLLPMLGQLVRSIPKTQQKRKELAERMRSKARKNEDDLLKFIKEKENE